MINKEGILKCSVANFTKFGSKRFSMDELARALGVSKKTLYKMYPSKKDLVIDSVRYLVDRFKNEVHQILDSEADPVEKVVLIYKQGFDRLSDFRPSFIFGLKKYYPEAELVFEDFRNGLVYNIIMGLLKDAQEQGLIRPEVNVQLFCSLYFKRMDEIAFKNDNLFDTYSNETLWNHFIVYSLAGITTPSYKNSFLDSHS